jgi:4'-phosphopantetheinyl transferase
MTAHGGGRSAGIAFVAVPSAGVEAACRRYGGLDAFLSAAEAASSRRFRRAEDRRDYSASHALFRLLAAWRLGLGPGAAAGLEVRRTCTGCGSTEHGKPAVEGVALSLSRSHGAVMAAAGPAAAGLGADIEKLPAAVFGGFDEFALAPGEARGLSDPERIRLWVAKEAVLKAAGVGLALDPSAVRLIRAGTPDLLRVECPANPSLEDLQVCRVPAPPGYDAAVSARAGLPPQRLGLTEIFDTKVSDQTSNV